MDISGDLTVCIPCPPGLVLRSLRYEIRSPADGVSAGSLIVQRGEQALGTVLLKRRAVAGRMRDARDFGLSGVSLHRGISRFDRLYRGSPAGGGDDTDADCAAGPDCRAMARISAGEIC